jgi:glycerol-3-phosphate dehydrogenase (NAD(P)+)
MSEVAVVGAGAWGTALAIHAVRAGHSVALWARTPAAIGSENSRLPGVAIPLGITVTGAFPEHADAMLIAVPVQHLRATLGGLRPPCPLLLCCKGMESSTSLLPLEIAAELWPGVPACVLTGPNFAAEMARGLPAASVVAGDAAPVRARFIELLGSATLRLYGNDDPVGAQIGGAAKNVIAIAAGTVIGAGLGENARAALVTRGLAEIARLAEALGGKRETVAGLSGLGDLLLTCTGAASRNFSYGLALGRGSRPEQEGVVEGVPTAAALVARAAGLDLPLCSSVAALLAGTLSVAEAVRGLMGRPSRDE